MRLAVVSQLGRGLSLDGLTKTGVDLLGGGTANGVLSRDGAGSLSIVVGLEGAESNQYGMYNVMDSERHTSREERCQQGESGRGTREERRCRRAFQAGGQRT